MAARTFPVFPQRSIRLMVLILCVGLLVACAGATGTAKKSGGTREAQAPPTATPNKLELTRANPGYIQWLERQSMLRQAPELTAVVTGSALAWNAPSTVGNTSAILDRADIWLDFNPYLAAWTGDATALAELKQINLPRLLAAVGMRGLFIAPAAESGADWNNTPTEAGKDAVSFSFAPTVGKDTEHGELQDLALTATSDGDVSGGVLLGGDILPVATGLGPDFFLAVRGVRDYPGLYMMVEVPHELWGLLPLSRLANEGGNSEGMPISAEATAQLATKGILPPPFSRDVDPGLTGTSGWAATSEIVGVDGVNRRWLYRWTGSPRRAVLNWDDPSSAARRVFSASVIRQVGLLHQPLVGLSVTALWGQEPAAPGARKNRASAAQPVWSSSPEPALSALRTLSRDVRRYGGWSLLRDPVPALLLSTIQAAGVDFALDTVTSPALEYALLTGDAAPLNRALSDSLARGEDHARLWRIPATGDGLRFDTMGLSVRDAMTQLAPAWREALMTEPDGPLRVNAFTLAAAVASPSPADVRRATHTVTLPRTEPRQAGTSSSSPKAAVDEPEDTLHRVQAAHMLQIAFRVMQPGLLMLSGGDLAGVLSLPNDQTAPGPVAWIVDGSPQISTRKGLPAAAGCYPALDAQALQTNSFGHELATLAALRRETGVATGKLAAIPIMDVPSAAGVLTLLPDGNYLLIAGNFSGSSWVANVNFPAGLLPFGGPGQDAVTGNSVAVDRDHLRLRMEPWQYRVVRLAGVN